MIRAALSLALVLIAAAPARAETVVAGVSLDEIGITARFDGTEVLIYGAVRREEPEPDGPPLHVIVTLEGPAGSVTIRRKEKIAGIWVNTEEVGVSATPTYYSVASTGPLGEILDPAEDVRQRISVPLAVRAFSGPLEVEDARPFTEALLRIRMAEGQYTLSEGSVALIEGTLFRADFQLPANLVEGDYKMRIYLLRGGQVIDSHRSALPVRKIGLERTLFLMSRENAYAYGLMSLVLAVVAGWAASAAFRLMRR
ncbi:TIGR02186 family protein [Phaeovulum sp.]|uniref:TIGR02186 family protein n=1 Tax=Phaeovulum sp. TaxID=2934796 RepID=UPI003566B4AD